MRKLRSNILFALILLSSSASSKEIVVSFVGGNVSDSIQSVVTHNFNTFISAISPYNNEPELSSHFEKNTNNQNVSRFIQSITIASVDIASSYICHKTKDGYEIRDVIVNILQRDSIYSERQLTVSFSSFGDISNISFSIDKWLYNRVFLSSTGLIAEDSIVKSDKEDKYSIVNFIEQYQTSFEIKDMAFIEALFSDDALIITGASVKRHRSNDNNYQGITSSMYKKYNKETYLTSIRREMMSKEKSNLRISDIEIEQHPLNKHVYGVTVVQKDKSGKYDDERKLFLIIDASTENLIILKKMFLSKRESIDIRDFSIKQNN